MSQNTKPITKPAPLGRGLSALFGDGDKSYQPKNLLPNPERPQFDDAAALKSGMLRKIPLTWLAPGSYQPRRHFDEDAIKSLADSIKERGVLEPLIVRPVGRAKDAYEIIAGERRWRASQMCGLHEVPVIVRELTDREALEFGIIENVQRQDLSPLEEAEGYQRLISEFEYSQETVAKAVGKSRPHITNLLRILTLPHPVKQMIENGELTLGHARAVITAKDPLALAKEIARKGLNVRQAENLAKQALGRADGAKAKTVADDTASSDVLALEKELERVIGLKVKIKADGKAGSLTLFYKDLDQLDEIIKKLRG